MKQAPEQLVKLLEPVIEGLGYECVGIEYHPHPRHGLLRVYIDKEGGIVLDDCTKVSHQLSGVLDVEDPIQGNYQLEVSSPGMDRPLFKLSQFERYIGSQVKISLFQQLEKRKNITGFIKEVTDGIIKIQEDERILEIPFKAISKARLVPDYLIDKGIHDGK
ncbi:MAG: ribosome maturation factor RimP [Gammaproteobacteria bacterium]